MQKPVLVRYFMDYKLQLDHLILLYSYVYCNYIYPSLWHHINKTSHRRQDSRTNLHELARHILQLRCNIVAAIAALLGLTIDILGKVDSSVESRAVITTKLVVLKIR